MRDVLDRGVRNLQSAVVVFAGFFLINSVTAVRTVPVCV